MAASAARRRCRRRGRRAPRRRPSAIDEGAGGERRPRRSAASGRRSGASIAAGSRPAQAPSPSGWLDQNIAAQIRAMAKSVSRPDGEHRERRASSRPAASSPAAAASLAQKPEKGGMPASDSAGTRNSSEAQGAARQTPPASAKPSEPAMRRDRAGAEEQVRLHQHVLEQVEQRADDRERASRSRGRGSCSRSRR